MTDSSRSHSTASAGVNAVPVGAPPAAGLRAVWQPLRGPLVRWPQLADVLIALLAGLLTAALWSVGDGETLSLNGFAGLAAAQLAFLSSLALLWRRSHPWQVHAVVMAASVLVYFATPVKGLVAMAFSLYSLGRYEAQKNASLLGVAASVMFVLLDRALLNPLTAGGTMTVVMVVGVWYLGRRLRFRAEYLRLLEERARHLEREQHAEAERAVAAERSRIAREMHDVVAHQLSLMTVQAGAARTVARTDPEAATEAMAAVEQAGRRALAEMRQLLNVLRPERQRLALAPQPGVRDLPALIAQVNAVGPAVTLHTRGDLAVLPARLDLTVYRLVQEALTNVIKHAGPGVQVAVDITGDATAVGVTVRDSGRGPLPAANPGHGLAGMRERVSLLGGDFSAGAARQGGFEVCARLPRLHGDQDA
ncbi:sensor histidine kinase [Simiduia sp. 21SJ11W-1]|uniref:sensor histidine kinase n=1 Tax=Simiduia sp. 21SJ11W-1 TaxID=2909669 RepID=UPI0020A00015|nr:sensor histidine kinase [Simiduia sp. 21SJ11W-1]UTA46799.1 sensor histidine kinase [Simiduia sp. 21SJ11W-1]